MLIIVPETDNTDVSEAQAQFCRAHNDEVSPLNMSAVIAHALTVSRTKPAATGTSVLKSKP